MKTKKLFFWALMASVIAIISAAMVVGCKEEDNNKDDDNNTSTTSDAVKRAADSTACLAYSHADTTAAWNSATGKCVKTRKGESPADDRAADSTACLAYSHADTTAAWNSATGMCVKTANSNGDDEGDGTYAVSNNDSPQDLLANAAKGITKLTITSTGEETENGTSITYKAVFQIDSVGKKYSRVGEYTINGQTAVASAYLYDGTTSTSYRYRLDFDLDNLSNFPNGDKTWCKGTISSSDYYSPRNYLPRYESGYQVQNGKLVRTYESTCYTEVTEISFNASKRVKEVKSTTTLKSGASSSECSQYSNEVVVETYSYDANPALPSGYNDLSKYTTCSNGY